MAQNIFSVQHEEIWNITSATRARSREGVERLELFERIERLPIPEE
jgi:hypothetical protein